MANVLEESLVEYNRLLVQFVLEPFVAPPVKMFAHPRAVDGG